MARLFNRLRHSQARVPIPFWLPRLLVGSGLILNWIPAEAQQRLPEPRIFDELPPASSSPPTSPIPTFNVPTSPSPPASVSPIPTFDVPTSPSLPDSPDTNTAIPGREFNFQAPSSPIPARRPTSASNLYRVEVDGYSPVLLSQVRQIEPDAFVRQGQGVIQAGVFSDENNAQLRVRELAARGIRAQVIPLMADNGTDTVASEHYSRSRAYFVIIPGGSEDLPDIAAKVVQMGIRQSAINQRDSPRGAHVAVGPFDSRGEAERWSSYLRSLGMDARVYFGY